MGLSYIPYLNGNLRKTFGSNCVMSGASLATVQAWLGHSSIETTIKHYSHLVNSFRKEELRRLREEWTPL